MGMGTAVRATRPGARRRAALAPHAAIFPERSGADGEVGVRFEAVYGRAEPAAAERRLLLAVLEDGIRTFLKHARVTNGRGLRLRREASTRRDRRDVFAFEAICEVLGIDAERLRRRVLTESAILPASPGAS
jgi:hypothetical protein